MSLLEKIAALLIREFCSPSSDPDYDVRPVVHHALGVAETIIAMIEDEGEKPCRSSEHMPAPHAST